LEKTTGRNYRDLIAWQKAVDLVELVYTATRDWPKVEVYGLSSQIRRAAVSVPSNIAEGQGRNSTREFVHHLSIAHGSLREVETQAIIAGRLNYAHAEAIEQLLNAFAETGRLIRGLMNALSSKTS
jgi:four helix bundle protein